MKILFTGGSSFTGRWFVSKLVEAGHNVWTTFTHDSIAAYGDDVRGRRVAQVAELSRPIFSCRFGDERFCSLLEREGFDLLCHHAADAANYKSPSFDVGSAVCSNTRDALRVFQTLAANRNAALLLTGTFFEGGEGAGSEALPSFSPYGLSKKLTAEVCIYYCRRVGLRMGKFVIPNPFGPWEEPRFTTYLMRTWLSGDVAQVRTPDYVRDNIHASLLAAAYVQFAEQLPGGSGISRTNPSGYIESQGAFAERVAREMRARTNWQCRIECARQTEFDEPRVRINTEPVDGPALGWNESAAWNDFAEWYRA
jgi:UDP-glucose 4-epimerase